MTATNITTTGSSSSSADDVSMRSSSSSSSPSSSLWKRSAVLSAAFNGGISGCIAMIIQVILLMWLRTVVNYQYKTGIGIKESFQILYNEGGILRFYRGITVSLVIGPISRFGDTAANEGIKDLFSSSTSSRSSSFDNNNTFIIPVWVVTIFAALVAAMWRVVITPLDTIKTTLQVSGSTGWHNLISKIGKYGVIKVLWAGAFGNWLANLFGYYPWFVVNNWLEKRIPQPVRPQQQQQREDNNNNNNNNNINKEENKKYQQSKLIRRAIIGFCSSFVSDCISNGIRVIKTYKQTSDDAPITYADAIIELYHQSNNSISFLYRGLELKLLCNCLSGILFSILWKMFMERMNNNNNNNNDANNNNSNNAPSLTTNSDSMYSNSGREQRTNSNDESSPLLRD